MRHIQNLVGSIQQSQPVSGSKALLGVDALRESKKARRECLRLTTV